MCAQYYLILNKKLNIHELYNGHGIYRYNRVGINWRAYASFFIAVAPLLPGFSKSINNSLDVGGCWKIYTFSCLYGFVVSGLTYYIICQYVSGVGEAKIVSHSSRRSYTRQSIAFDCVSQADLLQDEAVYPPSRLQGGDLEIRGADPEQESYEEKNGEVEVAIGTKEVKM